MLKTNDFWPIGNSPRWVALSLVVLALVSVAGAQTGPPFNPTSTQFDMTGFIQNATLDAAGVTGDELAGGTITVNNQLINVPRNTVLQMPAAALTWMEVFAYAPAPYGIPGITPGATGTVPTTGMSMSDGPWVGVPVPLATYEVHVQGNRVGDTYIAGLIFLAQHSLQSGQGFINWIDYTTGIFEVGGQIGVSGTGARVKINDPQGRFGRAWTPDRRFTIDENNPTVRSETAYPMCIPASDPASASPDANCPQKNRPAPNLTTFEINMPTVAQAIANPLGPDPRLMAPFEIGDFVTYSGILVADPAPLTTTYIAAYQVIGNVGLFTAPGDDPSYVAIDVGLIGTGGTTTALTEAAARTRFEGFTTDPSRNIFLWGIDVDPCSGAQIPRAWGSIDVDQGAAAGGAVKGRWRFRPPNKVLTMPPSGSFLAKWPTNGQYWQAGPTREVRAVRSNLDLSANNGDGLLAVPPANANGLFAGLYQAPIFEFIFAENAGTGNPIVANNFQDMSFLAYGSGPWETSNGPIVGQLSPWPFGQDGLGLPLLSPPPAPICAVVGVPIANAGPEQTVASGANVTLQGSGSNGLAPYSYSWTQIGGTPVALTGALTANPTFTAPLVPFGSSQAQLTFQLVVTDSNGASSAPAQVWILVNPVALDSVTISLVEYRTTKLRLTVDANSTAQPNAILTMQAYDASGNAMFVNPQPMPWIGGLYEVILVGAGQPDHVTVFSNFGGTKTSGITRLRQ
jgi:hypothetical protein